MFQEWNLTTRSEPHIHRSLEKLLQRTNLNHSLTSSPLLGNLLTFKRYIASTGRIFLGTMEHSLPGLISTECRQCKSLTLTMMVVSGQPLLGRASRNQSSSLDLLWELASQLRASTSRLEECKTLTGLEPSLAASKTMLRWVIAKV